VRHKKKLLIPALAGVLAVFGLSASGAMADSGTAVTQLTSFHQIAVDDVGGNSYLFLSGSDGIVVTDLSGNYVATLDSGAGVAGVAVSADGSTVYAALTSGGNSGSIGVIDVSTITSSGATENYYQLGNGDVPGILAFQGGELWASYTDSSGHAGIGSFDPGTDAFSSAVTGWTTAPDLAADPQDSGTLVAVQPGSNAVAATYKIANGTLSPSAAQATLGQCSDETQLAVVPGGADFAAACGSSVNEYNASDLAAGQAYATGSDAPEGAAIDADGTVAVGSSSGIYVYGSGSGGTLENVFDLGSPTSLALGGLAWEDTGAAGPQLVAVVDSGGNYSVQVFSQPTVTRSSLSLGQPSTAVIGDVSLSGSLTLSTGAALPQGTDVTITSTAPDGSTTTLPTVPVGQGGSFTTIDTTPTQAGAYTYTATYSSGSSSIASASSGPITVNVTANAAKVSLSGPAQADVTKAMNLAGAVTLLGGTVPAGTKIAITRVFSGKTTSLPPVTVGANGSFTVTDTPTAVGAYTYTASYAGTQTIPSATGSFTLSVVRMTPALSLTTGATTVNYRTTIHVTAHLGTTYTNRTVSIYVQWDGYRGKALLKTGRVSSGGELTVSYSAPHSSTFSVVFAGDAHYASRTVTHDVGVRAATAMSMGGFYGTRKIGGTAYRLYHLSARIYLTASVAPGKPGECVEIEVQEHYSGAWHANETTGCSALNASSQLYGYLTVGNGDLGYQYRVRADYIRSASDVTNLSSDSGWQYVIPER
jgi:hypothetical protein